MKVLKIPKHLLLAVVVCRWMFFNYWNDEYYIQWYHQMFFSLTEGISSALVLLLADIHVNFSAHIVLVITSIASFHILISSFDQFVSNVLQGEGYSFQVNHYCIYDKSMLSPAPVGPLHSSYEQFWNMNWIFQSVWRDWIWILNLLEKMLQSF